MIPVTPVTWSLVGVISLFSYLKQNVTHLAQWGLKEILQVLEQASPGATSGKMRPPVC